MALRLWTREIPPQVATRGFLLGRGTTTCKQGTSFPLVLVVVVLYFFFCFFIEDLCLQANALSGEIEVFEKSMDSLDNQLARYRAMEKDAKTLAQDHVLTAELSDRLIDRIELDPERNIHVTFRFKNEFQGKAVELCATM